jgi:hypothetical protein
MGMSEHRTAQDVLDDHLLTSLNGTLEDDLERNYADDVTIVSNQLLRSQLPDCTFTYRMRIVDGETGLLSWTAESPAGMVEDGVDSYCIRDGRIQAQTIYYTVRPGP